MMKLDTLPGNSRTIRTAAIASTLLVAPFIILEAASTQGFSRGFPLALFGFMWVLALSFIGILVPMIQGVRAGNRQMPTSLGLLLRGSALIFIGWILGSIIADQMPCFLGVPNCD